MPDLTLIKGFVPNPNELFPWSPIEHKDTEFWCARLGQYVYLTANLESTGTYYVYIAGQNNGRTYPVKGHELVFANDQSAKKIQGGEAVFLPVNKSNWNQIKNFLIDNFIPSYAWNPTPEQDLEQVKAGVLAHAKAPRNGLARLIEQERTAGFFLDKTTFDQRMKRQYESFPWLKFADFLDFSVPIT